MAFNTANMGAVKFTSSSPKPILREMIKEEEKKELLIFVVYLVVGNASAQHTSEKLKKYQQHIYDKFHRIEKSTNYLVEFFLYPIKEGITKMECIYSGETINSPIDISKLLEEDETNYKGFTVGEDPEDMDGSIEADKAHRLHQKYMLSTVGSGGNYKRCISSK